MPLQTKTPTTITAAAAAAVLVTDRRRHLPSLTPTPPQKQLSRTSILTGVSYGGMYPGRGQMSSTGADESRVYSHARHLILMRYISALCDSSHAMHTTFLR